jgi:hypothetical protein
MVAVVDSQVELFKPSKHKQCDMTMLSRVVRQHVATHRQQMQNWQCVGMGICSERRAYPAGSQRRAAWHSMVAPTPTR